MQCTAPTSVVVVGAFVSTMSPTHGGVMSRHVRKPATGGAACENVMSVHVAVSRAPFVVHSTWESPHLVCACRTGCRYIADAIKIASAAGNEIWASAAIVMALAIPYVFRVLAFGALAVAGADDTRKAVGILRSGEGEI